MKLVPIPPETAALRRITEELWLPYHRELEDITEEHALADHPDMIEAEIEFRRDWIQTEGRDAWLAVDVADDTTVEAATTDAKLLGFITTEVERAPPVFDRPDRLMIGDVYVVPDARGGDVADALVAKAVDAAESADCTELALDVDVDNDRARAYYRRLGFTPLRYRMRVPVDAVTEALSIGD